MDQGSARKFYGWFTFLGLLVGCLVVLAYYKDEYRERIEVLVRSKMEGVVAVPETKKAKPAAKSLMEALRMTAESLK